MKGKELVALNKKVVASFTSSDWAVISSLLNVHEAVYGSDRLLRSQRFGDDDYEGESLVALRKIINAAPENLQALLDYLADKYPASVAKGAVQSISSGKEAGRQIVFSPQVFKVPEREPDPTLVSVMMPFGAATRATYSAIQEAAKAAGLSCRRADDMWENSTVIQDVFSLIYDSFIVVCDFSGKNPNVFYEAGIAHTLGKHVVPITQQLEDIPFDLRHHRHARYLDNTEGRLKLKGELESRFTTLVAARRQQA